MKIPNHIGNPPEAVISLARHSYVSQYIKHISYSFEGDIPEVTRKPWRVMSPDAVSTQMILLYHV